MTDTIRLGMQMQNLLSTLADHGAQHLNEIDNDLSQTSFLLGEAIDKLGASFLAIHAAVLAQQQAVNGLLAQNGLNPEAGAALQTHYAEIERHVNAAVTGLQFQDMTGQLIGRTMQRVHGLREVLQTVGGGSAALPVEAAPSVLAESLSELAGSVEARSVKLESALWKAVCQTHMESGDVELF